MPPIEQINQSNLKEGMLIFQTLPKQGLGQVISDATDSDLAHVGILHKENGQWYVIESIGNNGQLTPINSFAIRNSNHEVWLKEIRGITETLASRFTDQAYKLTQKLPNYDVEYKYDNDKLYCSELVALAANAVGINLFNVDMKARWLDTSEQSVKVYLKQVHNLDYDALPESWRLIPPSTLFYSDDLKDPDFIVGQNGPSANKIPNNALYDTLPGKNSDEKFEYLNKTWSLYFDKVLVEKDGDRQRFYILDQGRQFSLILFSNFPEEKELADKIHERLNK